MINQKPYFCYLCLCFIALSAFGTLRAQEAEKSIYVPSMFGNINLNNDASKWSYARSRESENFIVFWEAGFGADPKTTSDGSYRVDVDAVLDIAEASFDMYSDSLKFIIEGESRADSYKMIILLYYSTTWQASGSGVDDMIGLLSLSANAAQTLGEVVAHEVGHCFQYQVHCDGHPGGWMYGLGPNGEGGNGWWEQCAQWMAFKVFPEARFTNHNFGNYLANTHKHILHETPRYANYFLPDYWTFLHGEDFIGELWRESQFPEDPVDAYKRITAVTQEQFNDEMYDHAARLITWDIPSIRAYGRNYTSSHASSPLTETEAGHWIIDPSKCLENYGYNAIRLNVPDGSSEVTVYFQGKSGAEGYRSLNYDKAGWRYGLVALLKNGGRVYSPMHSAVFDSENPKDTLSFTVPDKCDKLWLVVTGAPQNHWHHQWDNDDTNDEQWPYQVGFANTNLYGVYEFSDDQEPHSDTLTYDVALLPFTGNANSYPSTPVEVSWEAVCRAFTMQASEVKEAIGSSVRYCAVTPSGSLNYQSTANAPGHWFNKEGEVTTWGNNSYIFSEFKPNSLTFNIGQYPNLSQVGDQYTIRQALVYTPSTGSSVQVMFEFSIRIVSPDDLDGDGVANDSDSCPYVANGDQTDLDEDSIGDGCDILVAKAGLMEELRFGEVPLGTIGSLPLEVSNIGTDKLIVNDLLLPDGFGTTTRSLTIDGGASAEITINFEADEIGSVSDTLFLQTNAGMAYTILSAQAVLPLAVDLEASDVMVSPNPARERVHISWEEGIYSFPDIRIIDLSGRLQQIEYQWTATGADIDVSGFKGGVYLLKINGDAHSTTLKLIKN